MSKTKFTAEQVVDRLNEIADRGEAVRQTHSPNPPGVIGFPTLDSGEFSGWRTQALAYLRAVLGHEHTYTQEFDSVTNQHGYTSEVDRGRAILLAAAEDVRLGYLADVREILSVDLFADFLEMAEHLLDQGLKDPAAMLGGAVLEDGLRRIATKHEIAFKPRDDISALNAKCASKDVYSRLVQKKIAVWAAIRNNADHAHFDEYTTKDVETLLAGVGDFLTDQLG